MIRINQWNKLTFEEKIDYSNRFRDYTYGFSGTHSLTMLLLTTVILILIDMVRVAMNPELLIQANSMYTFLQVMWVIVISFTIIDIVSIFFHYREYNIWIKSLNLEDRDIEEPEF